MIKSYPSAGVQKRPFPVQYHFTRECLSNRRLSDISNGMKRSASCNAKVVLQWFVVQCSIFCQWHTYLFLKASIQIFWQVLVWVVMPCEQLCTMQCAAHCLQMSCWVNLLLVPGNSSRANISPQGITYKICDVWTLGCDRQLPAKKDRSSTWGSSFSTFRAGECVNKARLTTSLEVCHWTHIKCEFDIHVNLMYCTNHCMI